MMIITTTASFTDAVSDAVTAFTISTPSESQL